MITKFTAEALNRVRSLVTKEIKNKLRKEDLIASQRLYKSISGVVYRKGDNIFLDILAEKYFSQVDEGTKPRTRLPNISAISDWAKAKGLSPRQKGDSDEDMVYRIAKRIRDFGTIKRFGNVGPSGAKILNYIDVQYGSRITKEISEGYFKDLEIELDKNIK
jgi:hypothetical protein